MIFVVNKNATDQGIDPSEPARYTKGREFARPSLVPPRMADLFVLYSVNHFLLCALNEADVIRYVIKTAFPHFFGGIHSLGRGHTMASCCRGLPGKYLGLTQFRSAT